ncbi:hypothetical protein HYFRA_00002748 [Hymenoscyphus fraxineus]|uniref:Zn(2)-C6 fungal-type domain-containing protein n=1 Tax=Hymenoscyphus fraxineus TaxID=746836 RepID=A0A9N9PL02_9HELO|nr:hypothetical protein HYFRA_00002748 [Hymenoscyphus fraxineus]
MSSSSNTPPEDYFNDLSLPTGNNAQQKNKRSTGNGHATGNGNGGDSEVPKPKRIACIICRKRKLKCDGAKPSCSTCTRLGHSCAYDEVRKKSGPKRGYVKALEERLKQVETLLKTQEPIANPPKEVAPGSFTTSNASGTTPRTVSAPDFGIANGPINLVGGVGTERWGFNGDSPGQPPPIDDLTFGGDMSMAMGIDDSTFTWEMIGLGLEEPLPPQDTIDELHTIYFDKIHPSLPMIHKYRYLAAMNLAPNQRPPVALRYIMWAAAASVVEKYFDLKDHFYQRARKYVEMDSLKGHGEHMISVANAQTHVLLASYEFKMMYFPRAWVSTGTAIRLCQMMGLHRLDGAGLDVKQCLPPPRDFTEREERRRTFWMAFCEDRYASIGTGWPMTIDEKDILSDLPSSEEAFEMSKTETTQSLADALDPSGACKLSPFAGVVLMACLFGRNLIHLHRPDEDDRDHDLNGEFWKRHRQMDNILLNTTLSLPSHLKLPNGLSNPNIVFTNMNIHTSTICLHQAAIYKADKNRLPPSISQESKVRCISAANEIASIMRMVSHMDLSSMNPFISFCLYVAARVFVQYLKSRPNDSQTGDSLRFLLSAMNALKRKNPLTESFLVQLDVDLEGLGMRNIKSKNAYTYTDDNVNPHSSPFTSSYTNHEIIQAPAATGKTFDFCDTRTEGCILMKMSQDLNLDTTSPVRTTAPIPSTTSFPREQEPLEATLQDFNMTTPYDHSNFPHPTTFLNSESTKNANSPDTGTTGASSNRPTPSSSTPSDSRSNLHPRSVTSGPASHETSPEVSHDDSLLSNSETAGFYGTGLGPDPQGFSPTNGGWGIHAQSEGLTPVGEGVFRQLMGMGMGTMETMGGMDEMDLGWEGGS